MSCEKLPMEDGQSNGLLPSEEKKVDEEFGQGSQGSEQDGRLSPAVNVDDERETWGKKADFLLSCIGYAVGLGNIWRFPYLCYANGGGAFLIPYLIMLVICGMPMFYMELAAGQYFSLGPIGTWGAICPLFKGVGMASIVVSFLVCVYYNVIIAWCIYFLGLSFRSEVLWKDCNNWWNTKNCYAGRIPDVVKNCSSANATNVLNNMTIAAVNVAKNFTDNCTSSIIPKNPVSPTNEFWNRYILEISDGIGNPGELKWELFLCLLFAWIGIYFCMWKGVKSSGKVVYFTATFPYLVLFILFIRGVALPGANKGIEFYLKPEWSRLKDPKVWVAAATQIFYSLGIGFGSLVAMGSYNKFHNNIFRDAITISLINCGTSIFAGFVIFSTLGFMSHVLNKPIEEVADSGPGLVFVVYPEAIAQMPISPLWAVLFFFMILTLGLDSQFGMMEAVITGLCDEYKSLNKRKELFVALTCFLCFIPGIAHVTQGGAYVLNLFDYQSGGVSLLFLGFFETFSLAWLYGVPRFSKDIADMIGSKPGRWWWFTWKICAPTVMIGIFFYSISQWSGITYGKYKYPGWAEFFGWVIALSSMLCIPGFAIYQIWNTPGTLYERLVFLTQPNMEILRNIEKREGLEKRIPLVKV